MFLFGPPDVEKMKARRDVKGLTNALGYQKDKYVRKAAARALGEIGDARAVEPLFAALKDSDIDVRINAAEALGKIGAPAVELLIAALKNDDWKVRCAAAKALGKIGDARAVEPLVAALDDSDRDVRAEAIWALGEIGDARAVEPLIVALEDVGKRSFLVNNRHLAAKALDKLGWKPEQHKSAAWYWSAKGEWKKCMSLGAIAVEPLIAALKDEGNQDKRKEAAEALVQLGELAVDRLIALLDEKEEWYVRSDAAELLGRIGDQRAVKPLIAALKRKDDDQRGAFAEALGNIKDPRAVEPLIAALKNGEGGRGCVALALGKIKDPRAVTPLIAALKDKNQYVRADAARALGEIGDIRAVEPLIAALGSGYSDVREAAAEALGKIGDASAIEPLTAMLNDNFTDVRTAAAKAIEILKAKGGDLLASVEEMTARRDVEGLIKALEYQDRDVRKAAAEALDELGWKPAQDRAAAWYWIAKREWAKCVEIGLPAVEPLNAILRYADDDLRHEIVAQITESSGTRVVVGYYPLCFCGEKMEPIRHIRGTHYFGTLTCTSCGKSYSVTEDKDSITILIQATPVGWSGPVKKRYSKSKMYVQIENPS